MVDKELLESAIEFVREQHGGTLPPGALLEHVTHLPKTHPLKELFEWDNAKAGHSQRLAREGQWIRSVRTEMMTEEGPVQVKAYVRVTGPKAGYKPTRDLDDPKQCKRLLEQSYKQVLKQLEWLRDMNRVCTHSLIMDDEFDNAKERLVEMERTARSVIDDSPARSTEQAGVNHEH